MILFFTLFIIALLPASLFYLFNKETISTKELFLQLGIQLFFCTLVSSCIYFKNSTDTQTLNGSVTNKAQVEVSCEHSYECNCRMEESCSGYGKDRSCSSYRVCDTCYEHSNDYDWRVYSTLTYHNIRRIDRQGLSEPPRFTIVKIGDPVSITSSYKNYIKASPDSLFATRREEKYNLPEYPQNVYDYYKLDRIVLDKVKLPQLSVWNEELSYLNSRVGPKKQANVILVFTSSKNIKYAFDLNNYWYGGKKNDIIVVMGIENQSIIWTHVLGLEKNKYFQVNLRDSLIGLTLDKRSEILETVESNIVKFHKRKPMKDFEYLKYSITPTVTQYIVSIIFSLLLSFGLTFWFHKEDVI